MKKRLTALVCVASLLIVSFAALATPVAAASIRTSTYTHLMGDPYGLGAATLTYTIQTYVDWGDYDKLSVRIQVWASPLAQRAQASATVARIYYTKWLWWFIKHQETVFSSPYIPANPFTASYVDYSWGPNWVANGVQYVLTSTFTSLDWYIEEQEPDYENTLPSIVTPTRDTILTAPWGGVKGFVRNAATNDPLPYATVTVKQSGQVVKVGQTDSLGQYTISYLMPGTYLVTASRTGFYELTTPVTVSQDVYTTRNFQLTPSTGGGGCPFLEVWDGGDYVDEGLLNIHNAEGVDVTYEHTLMTVPEAVNGAYEFRLIEHPKTISDIDQVQLCAIFEDGTVEEFPLISARHSEDGNVLNLLLKSDDCRVEERGADHNGGTSQSIDLKFAGLGPRAEPVAFIFTIEGNNMIVK